MIAKKFNKQSDIDKYKKQRNKVNNLKKTAKEHFEQNLDTLILENISNPKTYWKIMKVTILVGMHSVATLRNVSVKVLHISSTSSKSESNAFQSTVSSLLEQFSWSVCSYNHTSL
jgi:hypothetical protein